MNRKLLNFWLIVLPDTALLYAALFIAIKLRYPDGLSPESFSTHVQAFSVLFALWLLVFFMHGLFETQVFRRYTGLALKLASAMVVNLLVSIIYFYLQRDLILTPRRFLLITLGISFVLVLVWHMLLKYFFKNRLNEGVYLFSFNQELGELEKEISNHSYLGFRVLGHVSEHNIGSINFDRNASVILPDNLNTKPEISSKFYSLRNLGVAFYNYRQFYENLLRKVYLNEISELWFLENINYKEKRFYNLLKRLIDLLFGLAGGAIFLLSLPFCALLIKLSSSGPVLFTQSRVGKDGKVFKVYKYRTMVNNAGNTWTSKQDPRITKTGKFLRKSRLDELPQFINLLLGNMSLVGPRPEQPNIVENLRKEIPFYDERHLVKPGLTGWAQINNIYAATQEETKLKLQYDLYYIKHRGFVFDLEIILKTIYYIFTWQGR